MQPSTDDLKREYHKSLLWRAGITLGWVAQAATLAYALVVPMMVVVAYMGSEQEQFKILR